MAKYGFNRYESGFKFGAGGISTTYYNSGLKAWSIDYQTVQVSWGPIYSDPVDASPTHWMLVKSYTGVVDNPYDGIIIAGGTFGTISSSYQDVNTLLIGREVTYSIWTFNGSKWYFCGADSAIIVAEKNSLTNVFNWIPKVWLNSDVKGVGDATGEADSSNSLVTMLSAFTFMYDKFRTETNLLSKAFNHALTPIALLGPQVSNFGFSYEPSLGDTYHRSLVGAGYVTNAYKGTALGIDVYTTALTHLNNKIKVGHNLLLDYNDSSFEESVGRWSASLGTLSQNLYTNSLSVYGLSLPTPAPYIIDHLYVPRALGFGALAIPGAGTPAASTLSLPLVTTADSVKNYAVPVSPNVRYIFSGWFRHKSTAAASVATTISWYNKFGVFISTTSAGTAVTTRNSSWVEATTSSDAGRNGKLSPLNASYAVITITVLPTSTANTTVFFDMFQIAEYQYSLEFQDARRIELYLGGQGENLLPNPSFEEGVGSWIASPNGSFAQDPTIYNAATYYGTSVGELTIQSAATGSIPYGLSALPAAWVSSDWFAVSPGQNYTFSAYISTEYPLFGRVVARIEFSNQASIDQQVTISSDVDGSYYANVVNYTDSSPVTLVANSVLDGSGNPIVDTLQPTGSGSNYYPTVGGYPIQYIPTLSRISVSAIAPLYSRDSGNPLAKITLYALECPVNSTFWIDGALFQNSSFLQPYFDGSGSPIPSDPVTTEAISSADTIWEYKNITNLIQNSSFELVTGAVVQNWTAATGTALTRDAGPGAGAERPVLANGTYANYVNAPIFYYGKYGSYMGKVSYPSVTITAISSTGTAVTYRYSSTSQVFAVGQTVVVWGNAVGVTPTFNTSGPTGWTTAAITGIATVTGGSVYSFTIASTATGTATTFGSAQISRGSISTTVYLPTPATGGEDFVVSAYVRAAEGVYSIGTTGSGLTTVTNTQVYQHDQYQWIRLHDVRQLIAGETSFTVTVSIVLPPPFYPYGPPGYTIATTNYFHIDGAQAEFGRIPNAFLNPADTTTSSLANPGYPSANMWAGQIQSAHGGKSSYFNNFLIKHSRLKSTLPLVMPKGSTWAIKPGYPTEDYPDLIESLIPSASFEKDLGQWVAINSTLNRVISRGSIFGDFTSHGAAYCLVTSLGTGTLTKNFGVTTSAVNIVPNNGYYASAAIRPANANSTGPYSLRVDFYDSNNNIVNVYIDSKTGQYTTSSTSYDGTANTICTDTERVTTINITHTDRWSYIANTFPAGSTVGAAYVKFVVDFLPTAWVAGQAFHVDRCVFRQ